MTQPQACKSLPIRTQNPPKIDHESILLNQLKTNSVLERFWDVLDTHFEVFFKYLRAKMISNSDKNTKMTKHLCFYSRNAFSQFEERNENFKKSFKVCTPSAYKTKKPIRPSSGPENGSLKAAKSRSKTTKKQYPKGESNHASKNISKKSLDTNLAVSGSPPTPLKGNQKP